MNKHIITFFILIITVSSKIYSQELISLIEIINLAKESSIEYQESMNKFLSEYWEYKKFKLNHMPIINFSLNPLSVNRSVIERYDFENNIEVFRSSSTINSNAGLNISQKIPSTGGNVSFGSNLSRIENIGETNVSSYGVNLIRFYISQPLFKHNPYRWEKKEIPLKLKKAKYRLLQSEQELCKTTASLFFNILRASHLYQIGKQEISNADTLYFAGLRLMEINRITPNELTELDLKRTNARISLSTIKQNLNNAQFELNTLLRGKLTYDFTPYITDTIPIFSLKYNELLEMAQSMNPFYIEIEQEIIQLKKNMDQANKQNAFGANLNVGFGLNQGGNTIQDAFGKPQRQQSASVSLTIPTFDWGINKKTILLAKREMELSFEKIKAKVTEFEQDLYRKTVDMEIVRDVVDKSSKARKLSIESYKIKIQQYSIGKITLQELNNSLVDMLSAEETYIDSIISFWINLYELQQITIHDLIRNQPLDTDFEALIKIL